MKCPFCGQEHPDNFIYCPISGQSLKQQTKKCPNCLYENVPIEAKFCPRCRYEFSMEKQRAINKMNDIFQSQIVVICAFKGSFIDIGQPFDGVAGRDKQIRLMKGENVINVEEYPKLRFGFSFYNRSYSEYIKDIILDEYDTSYITDMVNMFYGCRSLKYLDLSGFDTSGVSNMCGMFESCRSLESLDLSGFDTSGVSNMCGMFESCSSLESLDLSGFNTSGITNMSFMFRFCSSLKSLDLSSFNTLNVTDMSWMFDKCRSLKSLDLSSFNISNVTNMDSMFLDCDSLECVYLRNCNKYTIERITKALEEVGIDAKVITV